MFFWVWVVLQAPEQKGRERRAVALRRLLTGFALCGGPFPAFTGNAHIGNRFSPTVDLSQSLTETTLSCSGLCAEKKRKELREGGSFETHPSHLPGCGVFPSLFVLFYNHIFSLSFFSQSPHQTAALSSSCRAHVSLLSAVWFFKCQHTGACLGGGVTPASAAR